MLFSNYLSEFNFAQTWAKITTLKLKGHFAAIYIFKSMRFLKKPTKTIQKKGEKKERKKKV